MNPSTSQAADTLDDQSDLALNLEFARSVARWRFLHHGCSQPAWWRHDDAGRALQQSSTLPNYTADTSLVLQFVPHRTTIERVATGWLVSIRNGPAACAPQPARALVIALIRHARIAASERPAA